MSLERDDRLTILLPLKGRDLHTLRYLYHVNKIRLPFQILIADGQVNPQLAELLEQPDLFPNLRYCYVRYPNDSSLERFYSKMADVAARVTTPYVMQTDNDDFLFPSGLKRCVEFLDSEPDFASCGGHIPGFSLSPSHKEWPNLTGPMDFIHLSYGGEALLDKNSSSARERILRVSDDGRTVHLYYDVIRTSVLLAALNGALELAPQDLLVHNRYIDSRISIGGKRRFLSEVVTYARQANTSMMVFNDSNVTDTIVRLADPQLRKDHDAAARRLALESGDSDIEGLVRQIDRDFQLYVDTEKRKAKAPRRASLPVPAPLRRLLKRYRHGRALTVAGMRHTLLRRLAAAQADQAYLGELAADFASIDAVLEDGGFKAFVHHHIPNLLRAA